jgi:hypothetical protein
MDIKVRIRVVKTMRLRVRISIMVMASMTLKVRGTNVWVRVGDSSVKSSIVERLSCQCSTISGSAVVYSNRKVF